MPARFAYDGGFGPRHGYGNIESLSDPRGGLIPVAIFSGIELDLAA